MRLAIRIAACFCFAATGVLLSACSGVKIGTVPPVTTPINTNPPVEAGLPVVLTAQQLGQEGYDDPPGTVHKYLNSTLEVTGVVSSQDAPNSAAPPGPNEPIGGVVFKIQVNKKTGGTKDYNVVCHFKDPIKPGDAKAADVAKGKTLTVRGKIGGTDRDTNTTVNQCVIVNN